MMPRARPPSLAERYAELKALQWQGASLEFIRGRELHFHFSLTPNVMSRTYRCVLKVYPAAWPDLIVLDPDPRKLANGRALPHVYPHEGMGVRLCLWLPRTGEWNHQMRFEDTYLAWATEWLDYFEEWLETGEWAGGGEHPTGKIKRWSRPGPLEVIR